MNETAGAYSGRLGENHPEIDEHGIPFAPDVEKGLHVIKRILHCSRRDFADRHFFLQCALDFGMCYNEWPDGGYWLNHRNPSVFGLQQIPTEFADFAFLLSRLKIKTSVEVGVFRGASSYFLAAVLQRACSESVYALIDVVDHLIGYALFSEHLNLKKRIPQTSKDAVGEAFDFVFIDGDHSYGGSMTDYINLGKSARKVVAFHDIRGHEFNYLNGGTVRTWREFRQVNCRRMTVLELSHSPHDWMGIGVGILPGAFDCEDLTALAPA